MTEQIDAVIDRIKKGQNELLKESLDSNPGLADQKTKDGVSLLLFAKYCRNENAVELIKKVRSNLDVYEAVCTGDKDLVQTLIESNPGLIERPSADGFSVLGYACFFGEESIARYLVDRKADVNKASSNAFKVAPLHSACSISHYGLAELLLRHGADVNATQQGGFTPLHAAASQRQPALVMLLLQHGANPDAKTENGDTPISLAEKKNFQETAEMIRTYSQKGN